VSRNPNWKIQAAPTTRTPSTAMPKVLPLTAHEYPKYEEPPDNEKDGDDGIRPVSVDGVADHDLHAIGNSRRPRVKVPVLTARSMT